MAVEDAQSRVRPEVSTRWQNPAVSGSLSVLPVLAHCSSYSHLAPTLHELALTSSELFALFQTRLAQNQLDLPDIERLTVFFRQQQQELLESLSATLSRMPNLLSLRLRHLALVKLGNGNELERAIFTSASKSLRQLELLTNLRHLRLDPFQKLGTDQLESLESLKVTVKDLLAGEELDQLGWLARSVNIRELAILVNRGAPQIVHQDSCVALASRHLPPTLRKLSLTFDINDEDEMPLLVTPLTTCMGGLIATEIEDVVIKLRAPAIFDFYGTIDDLREAFKTLRANKTLHYEVLYEVL